MPPLRRLSSRGVDSPLTRLARAAAALPILAAAGLGASATTGPLAATDDRRPAASGARAPAAGAPVTVEPGLRYGRSRAMVLDVYRPQRSRVRTTPAVLVVHGGGWRFGDKSRMTAVASALAQAGLVAVNVNYSLAAWWRPGYPRQLRELRGAVRWIRRNADRLGVDRSRVGALGSSAGGHLAALLGVQADGRLGAGHRVGAVVTWSAPLDLTRPGDVRLAPAVEAFLGCPAAACPGRGDAASPTSHASRDDSPMLVFNSAEELVPVEQAERMAARLSEAGVRHGLVVLPGSRHATAYTSDVLGPSIEFLRRRLH